MCRAFCGLDGTQTFEVIYSTLYHKSLKINFLKIYLLQRNVN